MLRSRVVSPWKRVLFSWPAVAVLLVIAIYLSNSTYSTYLRERATAELLEERRAELASVEARTLSIEEKLRALDTPRGVEEEVRSRYEVAKPGEKVIVIVDQNAASSSVGAIGQASIWSRLRSFLGF